jgi:hypothetical protein
MASRGQRKKRVKRTQASMCGTKTRYRTQATAGQIRGNYIASGTDPNGVKACHCPFCGHFHVGQIWRPDLRQVKNRARQWK